MRSFCLHVGFEPTSFCIPALIYTGQIQTCVSALLCVGDMSHYIYVVIVFFKVKQDFFELLSDYHVDGQQRWSKVKEKMETDPRYKAVETSAAREELFKNYVERLAKVREAYSHYTMFWCQPNPVLFLDNKRELQFRKAWKHRDIDTFTEWIRRMYKPHVLTTPYSSFHFTTLYL